MQPRQNLERRLTTSCCIVEAKPLLTPWRLGSSSIQLRLSQQGMRCIALEIPHQPQHGGFDKSIKSSTRLSQLWKSYLLKIAEKQGSYLQWESIEVLRPMCLRCMI